MTATDMKAPDLIFPTLILAVAGLGGCAAGFSPATDAASPLAPRVEALVAENREYPRWADFPRHAPDGLTPAAVAERAGGLRAESGALAEAVARIDWTLADPAGFEAETRERLRAGLPPPIVVMTPEEIEALGRRLRDRGRAPPPIRRR